MDERTTAPLINPGDTCWRVERANRAAFLCDNAAYFSAAKAALLKARRSILLIGWEFDHRCRLDPSAPTCKSDRIGELLHALALERPALNVRVLVWDAALAVALGKRMMPQRAWWRFRKSPVTFKLDSSMPRGAAHHQKLLVIDDAVAFCSGDDFSGNRWDEPDHRDENSNRTTPRGKPYPPRHGLTVLVDGEAARALGNLARDRWRKAVGYAPAAPGQGPVDPWPRCVEPDLTNEPVGISRTVPAWHGDHEVRENEASFLAGIAAARRLLYFENQYFASDILGDAIAARLAETDGPEVVVVTGEHAPSFFDRITMDPPRDALIHRLRAADRFGRFHVYAPHSPEGRPVLMHSKVMIVDDRMIRTGSANVSRRSMRYDTECDLAIAPDEADIKVIAALRHRLVGHFLGVPAQRVSQEEQVRSSLAAVIEMLDEREKRRLRPLHPPAPKFPRSVIARWHLGDPSGAADAWRPWLRRRD